MYRAINGWTKAKMIAQIKLKNDGTRSEGWVTTAPDSPGGKPLQSLTAMLRGARGNCCFIGCFIPDDQYSQEMEASGILNTRIKLQGIMPLEPYHGMGGLMGAHDNAHRSTNQMHRIAEAWIEANVGDPE